MLLLLIPMALAGKWDGAETDIHAERVIAAPPEAVFSYLLDLGHLRAIFPTDCVGKWEPGERTFGEGANAIVRYDMAAMHRTLPMTLVRAEAPRIIDLDHLGPRGFITRWTLTPEPPGEEGSATKVRLETPLNAPPAPFRGYFQNVVRPEWMGCYTRTLDNLAGAFKP
ncbi:MAG: SRPBCC family protein [Pseudomonadota bacterium]|nr:SRPBCC family protein [Pseudomonadota bacterium]